jgi:phage shock protein C
MPDRRLERSESDRVIAGVCGGIGEWLGSDPTWVRIAWVVVAILTSVLPLLVIYIVLAAVLPTARVTEAVPPTYPTSAPRPPVDRRSRPDWAIVFGAALLAVGFLLLVAQFVPVRWDIIWPVSLIVLGIVVIVVALRPRSG